MVSLRNHDSRQDNNYQILYQNTPAIAKGFTTETERSAFTQLKWITAPNTRIYFRSFFDQYTNYSFVNLENTNIRFDETSFDQSVVKPEIQFEKTVAEKSVYVAGIGANFEMINASRYAGKQQLSTLYAFTQKEWYLLRHKLTIISGARLDKRTSFAVHLSPRIAVAYKPNTQWKFTASAGWGFKAPDFRHMYLNFYNAQIGYSLLGSNSLGAELQSLQQQGLLQTGALIANYTTSIPLQPESAFGWHIGASYHAHKLTTEWGLFRNDIKHLIDVYTLPFNRSNGLPIYSYRNIGSVYTEGIEMNTKYQINQHWSIAGGYQFLLAKDKQVLAQIGQGVLYKRDPLTYQTSLVNKQTYFGLANRSKHSANGKIVYENQSAGFDAYFRAIYRGKFGFMDVNGNNIIDDNREMTPGYWLINMASSKTLGKKFRVQIGIEDILNYTNALQLPNIAGRTFFTNINYTIQHHSNN